MNTILSSPRTYMAENTKLVNISILNLFRSVSFHGLTDMHNDFQQFYAKTKCFIHTKMDSLSHSGSFFGTAERDHETCSPVDCKSCGKQEGLLTGDDIDIVLERLGMGSCGYNEVSVRQYDGKCRGCWLLEGASRLLEEKEASIEELKEAFSVFDKNGDGYIDAKKLQVVLCRLEFKEGLKLEDCVKMISAFDENGDGRIDLSEFRNMLENVK